jgi:hypothetical protein
MPKLNSIFPILLLLAAGLIWLNVSFSQASAAGLGAAPQQDASITPQAASATLTLTSRPTATVTVTPTNGPTPTLTPLPEEYVENPDQSTGIIFGAVFLLIIIVGGTFFILRSNK